MLDRRPGQTPCSAIVQYREVLQVIIGIAEDRVEDHLAIQGRDVMLRPAGDTPDDVGQVGISDLIISLASGQGLPKIQEALFYWVSCISRFTPPFGVQAVLDPGFRCVASRVHSDYNAEVSKLCASSGGRAREKCKVLLRGGEGCQIFLPILASSSV